MKQGWEIKKLGEICNKITNIKWNEIDKTTSFPYIDLSAVDRENSSIHDYEYINISNAPSRAKQIVKVGDILFATTRPMLKRACIIPNEFNNAIASTGFCVLRPQGTVLSEWIYHNIKSNRFYKYIEPIQKGVSYPAVTDNEVKDFCIPVPPRAEQERIVEELDCLSGVIEKKREQLRELDALAQSIFYSMFGDPITNEKGWEVKKLEDVCRIINGFAFPSSDFNDSHPIKAIKITNVGVNEFINDDSSLPIVYNNKNDYKVHTGDIVLALTRTIISTGLKRAFVPKEYNDALVNQRVAAIIVDSAITNKNYVYSFLGTEFVRKYVLSHATALMQPNLSIKDLRELPIMFPAYNLQQEFASKIEAIEKQKELIKQSITETEELFNSRMDYYFN